MTYRVEFSDSAAKELLALPRAVQMRVRTRIDALAHDPRPAGSAPLTGDLRGRRKLRVGDYRIVYAVEDDVLVVWVVAVGHRQAVYGEARRRRR